MVGIFTTSTLHGGRSSKYEIKAFVHKSVHCRLATKGFMLQVRDLGTIRAFLPAVMQREAVRFKTSAAHNQSIEVN